MRIEVVNSARPDYGKRKVCESSYPARVPPGGYAVLRYHNDNRNVNLQLRIAYQGIRPELDERKKIQIQ